MYTNIFSLLIACFKLKITPSYVNAFCFSDAPASHEGLGPKVLLVNVWQTDWPDLLALHVVLERRVINL